MAWAVPSGLAGTDAVTASLTHPPALLHARAEPVAPASASPRLPRYLGPGLLVALVVTHLVLGGFVRVPIIHPDEFGYLDNARFLVHGGLRPETEYYPGLSLLLVPLSFVFSNPITIWRGALALNAVLAGAGGLVTWWLCGNVTPALSTWRRLGVSVLVSVYPSFLLFSNLSLAESLFALVFGLAVLLAARALRGEAPAWWAALGLVSGALVLVHPRGLAVVVAVVIAAAVVLRPWRRAAWPAGAALTVGLTLSLAVTRLLVTATRGRPGTGFAAYQPDSILSKSLSFHGAVSLVWELLGQLFYLSVATIGLLPLGLALGLRALRAVGKGDRSPAVLTRAFCALCFLGVWGLSSLFMNLGDRTDKLMYGRYNEGVIAPLLIIALADVVRPKRLRRLTNQMAARRWLAVGAVSAIVGAVGLLLGRSTAQLHGELNPVNVLGLYPLIRHLGGPLDVVAIAAIGAALIVGLALIAWRLPAIALVIVAIVWIGSALDSQVGYFVPGSRSRAEQRVLADAVRAINSKFATGKACIGYDPIVANNYNYFEDRFLLPGQPFQWFDAEHGQQPCGALVITNHDDLAAHLAGVRLVTHEEDVDQSLWVMPGPLQDRMGAAGWLFPVATPGPLPADARHALITVRSGLSHRVRAGQAAGLTVLAVHDQAGAPWPSAAGLRQGADAVRLALRWYTPDHLPLTAQESGSPVNTTVVELPRDVLPGQTARLSAELVARGPDGATLPAGTYKVRLALFQEGGPGFTDQGITLDVVVT